MNFKYIELWNIVNIDAGTFEKMLSKFESFASRMEHLCRLAYTQIYSNLLSSWQGAWMSVNGNPDIYILREYDGNYYLLAHSYDKESERGSFSLHDIGSYMKD